MPNPESKCHNCQTLMHWAFYSDNTYELKCPICNYYKLYQIENDHLIKQGYDKITEPKQELYEYEAEDEEWMV